MNIKKYIRLALLAVFVFASVPQNVTAAAASSSSSGASDIGTIIGKAEEYGPIALAGLAVVVILGYLAYRFPVRSFREWRASKKILKDIANDLVDSDPKDVAKKVLSEVKASIPKSDLVNPEEELVEKLEALINDSENKTKMEAAIKDSLDLETSLGDVFNKINFVREALTTVLRQKNLSPSEFKEALDAFNIAAKEATAAVVVEKELQPSEEFQAFIDKYKAAHPDETLSDEGIWQKFKQDLAERSRFELADREFKAQVSEVVLYNALSGNSFDSMFTEQIKAVPKEEQRKLTDFYIENHENIINGTNLQKLVDALAGDPVVARAFANIAVKIEPEIHSDTVSRFSEEYKIWNDIRLQAPALENLGKALEATVTVIKMDRENVAKNLEVLKEIVTTAKAKNVLSEALDAVRALSKDGDLTDLLTLKAHVNLSRGGSTLKTYLEEVARIHSGGQIVPSREVAGGPRDVTAGIKNPDVNPDTRTGDPLEVHGEV